MCKHVNVAVLQVSESFSWTLLNIKAPWDHDHPSTYASQSSGSAFPYPPEGITTASFNNPDAESSNGYFSLPSSGAPLVSWLATASLVRPCEISA